MPSPAARTFATDVLRSRQFAELVKDERLRPLARGDARLYLHAALASHVAAWESYVERLVANFLLEVADPTIAKYLALHSILEPLAHAAIEKYNTPNAEKTRELLLGYTGYDPINDWVWPKRSMSGHQVRLYLNEILKVRHSFAHGFSMPSYAWNTSPSGKVRLTNSAILDVERFFQNLVQQTDSGLAKHIKSHYKSSLTW